MEVVFHGTCDICKSNQKLLISLPKETAKTLNITYGLNIANPIKWRICAICNYEIANIVMKYVETTTSHRALWVDPSKCYSCGTCHIIKDPSLSTKINEIREIGLLVLLNPENFHACFSCHHIIDTVIKYKNILQASEISQLSVQSFQNLTKSINNAKQTGKVRPRKNPRPVKLKPRIQECVVKLTKLDIDTLTDIIASSHVTKSTPKTLTKNEKKPLKLHQGSSWVNSGLQNGLSPPASKSNGITHSRSNYRRRSINLSTNVTNDIGITENGCESFNEKTRRIRPRKLSMNNDFIYFADKESTNEYKDIFSPNKKPKRLQKKEDKASKLILKDQSIMIKPCSVILERVKVNTNINGQLSVVQDKKIVESRENDSHNKTISEDERPCLHEQQNENSTPNIPKPDLLPEETPTKVVYAEDVTEILSSSSSTVSVYLTTYETPRSSIKSILTPDRNRNGSSISKTVSFSEYNELIYYEPEKVTYTGNEIELADLDDHFSEQSKSPRKDDSHNDESQEEVNKIIEEIVSQQF